MIDRRKTAQRGLKIGIGLAITVPVLATLAGWGMERAGYRLTANLTPSIPVGLYLSNSNARRAKRGELVAFYPHNEAARYAFDRGWMKPGSHYLKRVSAIAGDMVCADSDLTVRTSGDGEPARFIRVGPIATDDSDGRPLPHILSGCKRVPYGHFLPVGDGIPNSYDGRYYGFVPVAAIDASLRPLLTQSNASE